MERELWKLLYVLAEEVDKSWGNWLYTASDVLAIYFWAVVHDRPTSWATDPAQWPDDLRPRRMPTQSTVSRRLRKPETVALMTEMEEFLLVLVGVAGCLIHSIDGKPLTVSNVSKDADASFGRGAGGLQKGYKLHAVWGRSPIPIAWALTPMNVSEKKMARSLIPTLPGGGYLLADGNYDANDLYDLALKQGYQLVAKRGRAAAEAWDTGVKALADCDRSRYSANPSDAIYTRNATTLNGSLERSAAAAPSGLVHFRPGFGGLPAYATGSKPSFSPPRHIG